VNQKQKPRERSFIRELVPDWRPTREQVLWTVRSVAVLVLVLGILTLIGLPFGITLWAWVKLLIVPAVIAAGGLWFNRQQRDREMEIAEQRSQDEALQAYLDGMAQLLTDKDRPLHRAPVGDSLRTVARARTLTVLARLEGNRKGSVVQFLYESGLTVAHRRILEFVGADLRGAILSRVDLPQADLSGADLYKAILYQADLSGADLREADLGEAILAHTDLRGADLREADLSGANLSQANLSEADLSEAHLIEADLSGANLLETNLSRADLYKANLTEADGLPANLSEANLSEAILDHGIKYEDWFKSKGRGEGGENSGPS
jgi:uncharacterized protein YjbI with pentapeptide repeats